MHNFECHSYCKKDRGGTELVRNKFHGGSSWFKTISFQGCLFIFMSILAKASNLKLIYSVRLTNKKIFVHSNTFTDVGGTVNMFLIELDYKLSSPILTTFSGIDMILDVICLPWQQWSKIHNGHSRMERQIDIPDNANKSVDIKLGYLSSQLSNYASDFFHNH